MLCGKNFKEEAWCSEEFHFLSPWCDLLPSVVLVFPTCKVFSSLGLAVSTFLLYVLTENAIRSEDSQIRTSWRRFRGGVMPSWCFVPSSRWIRLPVYANNTGDDTLYFPDQRGKLPGSGCNGLHTIWGINLLSETYVAYLAYDIYLELGRYAIIRM